MKNKEYEQRLRSIAEAKVELHRQEEELRIDIELFGREKANW
jgi:hypothetical protein